MILVCALLLPGSAWAQRERAAADSTRLFALRPLVVTISKTPLRVARANFAISVVSPHDLALRQPLFAADALRDVTGAYIDEAVGAGGPTIIRLRGGEETFTSILIDGVQVNQNGGFFDFQGLPLGNIERIEVARGPQSAVWGSAAMAGVVNLVSRTGAVGPLQFGGRFERGVASGPNKSDLNTVTASGGTQRLRFAGEAGTTFMRGIHDLPNNVRSREAALRLDAQPGSSFDLGLTARYTAVEGRLPVRDQGATRAPLDPNARNDRDRLITALSARHQLTPSLHQQARLSNYSEDFLYRDQKDNVSSKDFFIFDETFDFSDKLRRTTAEYLLGFARGTQLRLNGGAQLEQEALDEESTFSPDKLEFERNSLAGFAELQASPSARLDLLLGSRVEKYDGLAAEHTPRASLGFALLPDRLHLRAAVARGFKAPNLQQQYADNPFIEANPDLQAESSVNRELGVDVSLAQGKVELSATAFDQDFTNLIRTVQQSSGSKQINRNVGRSDARGLEWELRVLPVQDVRLISTGAVIRTHTRDNQGLDPAQYPLGQELPFRPSHTLSLAAEWRATDRLSALLRTRVVGQQYVLTERFSGRRERIAGYTLVGANLTYQYSRAAQAYLRLDNLLNREYATAYDQRGMPLTASLGIRVGN